jgi:hypothetical protein
LTRQTLLQKRWNGCLRIETESGSVEQVAGYPFVRGQNQSPFMPINVLFSSTGD